MISCTSGCNSPQDSKDKKITTHHYYTKEQVLTGDQPIKNWSKIDTIHKSIDSLNYYATREWEIGNYQNALDYVSVAFRKAKKSDDQEELAKTLNTLGLIYWRLNNNESAIVSYKEAAKITKKLKLHKLYGLTNTNIGLIFKEQNDFDKAFYYNERAIEIFKKQDLYRDLGIAFNNQGQIFKKQGEIDSAATYYLDALNNYKKVDYKDGMAATYYNLAEVFMRKDQKEASINSAQKSLELGLQIDSKVRISEAYKKLFTTYEYFEQPDSALKYLKKYHDLNEEMLIAGQSEILIKYQVKLGSEIKNLQIQTLEKEKKLAENRLWFIGIGVFAFILAGVFFIYRHFLSVKFERRKLEIELQNSKKILEVKEQELKAYILDFTQKNQVIRRLQEKISKNTEEVIAANDEELANLLQQKILTDEDWVNFKIRFKSIYPGFFSRIKQQYQTPLTEGEIRFMVLFRLGLSSKEMARILGISPQSVRVSKMRLKKKLAKENFNSVEEFLQFLIV